MASGARSYRRPRRARLMINVRAPAAAKARAGMLGAVRAMATALGCLSGMRLYKTVFMTNPSGGSTGCGMLRPHRYNESLEQFCLKVNTVCEKYKETGPKIRGWPYLAAPCACPAKRGSELMALISSCRRILLKEERSAVISTTLPAGVAKPLGPFAALAVGVFKSQRGREAMSPAPGEVSAGAV